MRNAAYMEKCILGQHTVSVEALGWLNNELFSIGTTEVLIKWDLRNLTPKKTVTLTGGISWCMDIDEINSCIAIGTEQGFVNIFNVVGDELNFVRLFDKQEGRILCCKYDSTGDYIVTGSINTVRVWETATGHAKQRMSTSQTENNKETCVWSLVVLKDLTIIGGDSRGYITLWDGKNGNYIDSWSALDADVLTIALKDDEKMFCCSGVDPKIKVFFNPKGNQWIRFLKRSVHDHDVKALTFIDDKIISGGVDGFLNVSYSGKAKQYPKCQYAPFLPQPCSVVAKSSRSLLLKYFNYLEVWKLGRSSGTNQLADNDGKRKFLALDEGFQKIVVIKSRQDEPIICASISSDGNFVIYSTENFINLFQLEFNAEV